MMHEQSITQIAEPHSSWEFLHQGSPEDFIQALCTDAQQHPAVRHPYLQRLASGKLPDIKSAIRDYCHQYYFYSAEFPTYLEAVIGRLPSAHHREIVRQNLEEERGLDSAGSEVVSHVELFHRFRQAAGVTDEYGAKISACMTVLIWRDLFLQKCKSQHPGVGLGAIGIGTEMVVSTIYRYLHQAVARHTDMTAADYEFLTLHMQCDDEHGDLMRQISLELAEDLGQREALRFGVMSSLNLRNAFWDVMLARAVAT